MKLSIKSEIKKKLKDARKKTNDKLLEIDAKPNPNPRELLEIIKEMNAEIIELQDFIEKRLQHKPGV